MLSTANFICKWLVIIILATVWYKEYQYIVKKRDFSFIECIISTLLILAIVIMLTIRV